MFGSNCTQSHEKIKRKRPYRKLLTWSGLKAYAYAPTTIGQSAKSTKVQFCMIKLKKPLIITSSYNWSPAFQQLSYLVLPLTQSLTLLDVAYYKQFATGPMESSLLPQSLYLLNSQRRIMQDTLSFRPYLIHTKINLILI